MSESKAELLSAYLIVGTDELKVETVIKRLWSRLEEQGDMVFNSQVLEGTREINLTELLDSLNTPPLAAPYRLILIKEVEKGGKQLTEALTEYLAHPMQSTVLVMTAKALASSSRLFKAVKLIGNKAVIDASDRKQKELPAMVRELARSYQISLSADGAAKLVELAGSSTIVLNTEVKKLASYVLAMGRSDANIEDVSIVVARSNQPSSWDFVDAFTKRDLIGSLEILALLPGESPVGLLYLCVTRLREILQYSSLVKRGNGNLAKTIGKPEWQLRRLEALSRRYEQRELRELLAKAATADARMKSGEDARRVLEELLLEACY